MLPSGIYRQRHLDEKLNSDFYNYINTKKPKYVKFTFEGLVFQMYYKTCNKFVISSFEELENLPKDNYFMLHFDPTIDNDVILSTIINTIQKNCEIKSVKHVFTKHEKCTGPFTNCSNITINNYFMFEY